MKKAIFIFGVILLMGISFSAAADSIITGASQVNSYTSDSGFVHPGIGCSKETLEVMRKKVFAGTSPWADCFEGLRRTDYASLDKQLRLPTAIENDSGINMFRSDAETAWGQAIMYVVTGNEDYLKLPHKIMEHYASVDPDEFFKGGFTDSHIKIGKYVYTMCAAAEILRCVEPKNQELRFSPELISRVAENAIKPICMRNLHHNGYFMNQHTYAIMGTLAYSVLADDKALYDEITEWTTVNRAASNQGRNGSIAGVIRLVTENAKTGEAVEPEIQLIEMGRDQPHAEGNVYNLMLMTRTMGIQGTRVDEVSGMVVSEGGVEPIHFLNDRLLKGYALYCRYNIGLDVPWTPVFSETADTTATYAVVSTAGRGSFSANGLSSAYGAFSAMGYTSENSDFKAIEDVYTMLCKGMLNNQRSGYYMTNTHNYNFDFWTGLKENAFNFPSSREHAEKILAKELAPIEYYDTHEFENIYGDFDNISGRSFTWAMEVITERDKKFVRVKTEENPRTMVIAGSFSRGNMYVRCRGNVEIDIYYDDPYSSTPYKTVYLSDTRGQWKNLCTNCGLGGKMYLFIRGEGEVDFDRINDDENVTLEPAEYISERIAYPDNTETIDCSVVCKNENAKITYSAYGLFEGAKIDYATGVLTISPKASGRHKVYIRSDSGNSFHVREVDIMVAENLEDAKKYAASAFDEEKEYEPEALAKMKEVLQGGDIYLIRTTAQEMRLLTPRLEDGSIDYRGIVSSDFGWGINSLADSDSATFVSLWTLEKEMTFDFGRDFRVKLNALGIQARTGFPTRTNKCVFYGSDDGRNWVLLTEESVASDDMQILEVKEEYRDHPFRYIRIYRRPPYDINVLDMNAIRMYGERINSDKTEIHLVHMEGKTENTFAPDSTITKWEGIHWLSTLVNVVI